MLCNRKPIELTLSAPIGELIRDHAQAQGVTYESLVEACVRQGCASGGPVVLEPFGESGEPQSIYDAMGRVRETAAASDRGAAIAAEAFAVGAALNRAAAEAAKEGGR